MSQDPKLSRGPDYYSARASEERRLAMAAADPSARAAHLEMADRYAALSRGHGQPQASISINEQQQAG